MIEIKKSKIHGLGVFATEDIVKNAKLHVGHYIVNNERIRTKYTGYYNYSETPNCYFAINTAKSNNIRYTYNILTTNEKIKKGEELTLKYSWYDPNLPETEDNQIWNPLPDYLTIENNYLKTKIDIKENNEIEIEAATYIKGPNRWIYSPVGAFVKQQEDFNCILIKRNKKCFLKTIRNIKSNENITTDLNELKKVIGPNEYILLR